MTSPYPAGLIPPPAPWKGEARHVAIADYEPEGTGAFMRLYFPTDEEASNLRVERDRRKTANMSPPSPTPAACSTSS